MGYTEKNSGFIILRSSMTQIAFPFSSGLLAEFRVVYYSIDTHIFAIFHGYPNRLLLHFVAYRIGIYDFVPPC